MYLNNSSAVDVAWTRTGIMGSIRAPRPGQTFALDLRDNFVTVGARCRVPAASHVTIEPVAGFVVVVREHWSQQQGGYPRIKNVEDEYGVCFGVDARIGSRRVGLVPTFRVYVMNGDVRYMCIQGGPRGSRWRLG
jgi:hypothetical protein